MIDPLFWLPPLKKGFYDRALSRTARRKVRRARMAMYNKPNSPQATEPNITIAVEL